VLSYGQLANCEPYANGPNVTPFDLFEQALAHQRTGKSAQTDRLYAGTLRHALTRGLRSALAFRELGALLARRGEWDEAIDVLWQAVQLDPTAAEAHMNLGIALGNSGRILECIESYRRALEIRPEWQAVHGNLLYMMPFASQFDDEAISKEARAWNTAYAEPLRATVHVHRNDRQLNRRLRVGYVSPHFFDHCQSFFTLPLLTHHNRDRVEIFCYASVNLVDEITKQLQTRADVWRNVFHLDNSDLAQLIRKDEIDILVDLTMHMENGRLPMFAHKPAPIQVSWLAYPGTTGVEVIDYRITDRYLDPPEGYPRPHYRERSIILPNTFWCYEPRHLDIDCGPLPARSNGYVTFGSLNHFRKINGEVIELWAQVMNSVEGSRMLILAPQGKSRERVLSIFERRAIEPNRITFFSRMPLREYLELYRHIDICLDSFPYGGHATSLDASWMGVPVISLLGSTIVGRGSLTIASNLQLEHLVATTPLDYVKCATALASDLHSLEELRSTIRSRMMASPLMDHARFARNLEDAYAAVWRIWCAGGTSDRSPLVIADRRK
jgi:protein O-GlcNAc transferase